MTLDTEAEVRGHFSAELDAPRAARRFLTDALSGWGEDNLILDDARCVVTELANNAVLHAGSRFSVVIRSDAAQLRIAVADASPARPAIDLHCAVCSTRRSPPAETRIHEFARRDRHLRSALHRAQLRSLALGLVRRASRQLRV